MAAQRARSVIRKLRVDPRLPRPESGAIGYAMSTQSQTRKRLDQALVERGLVATRARARDLVLRGAVTVDGAVAGRPSQAVPETARLGVDGEADRYVSRGGQKLAAALALFGFDPHERVALDIGASTGGFTDVLLQAGASLVHAIDVGHDQLHPRLAADPRVRQRDGCDARTLTLRDIGEPVGAIVADVSFISLTKALATPMTLAAPGCWLVALIKPQFEAGPKAVGKGGVVRDPAERERAIASVVDWIAQRPGWRVVGRIESPLPGGSGNVEALVGAVHDR
jgi:23S rRNA (cytidine1920-2'-O)/16S rRNA (cytidine1409-2'-O)-methyltransferase